MTILRTKVLLAGAVALPLALLASRQAHAHALVVEVYQGATGVTPATDTVEVYCDPSDMASAPSCVGYRVCDGNVVRAVGDALGAYGSSTSARSCSSLQKTLGVGARRATSRSSALTTADVTVWVEDGNGKVIDVVGGTNLKICPNGQSIMHEDELTGPWSGCAAPQLSSGVTCKDPHVFKRLGTCAAATDSAGQASNTCCVDPAPMVTWSAGSESCSVYSSDPQCQEAGCRGDGGQVWALMEGFRTAASSVKCDFYEFDLKDLDSGVAGIQNPLFTTIKDTAARLGTKFEFSTDFTAATDGTCTANRDAAGACAAGAKCCNAGFECAGGTCVSDEVAEIERAAGGTAAPDTTTINRPGGRVQFVDATGIFHDKSCVFDGTKVTVGTSNAKQTIEENLDLRLFVNGSATLASRFTTEHDELFLHCGATFDTATNTWSKNCTTTNNPARDNTGLTVCGGSASLFIGPWSEASGLDETNPSHVAQSLNTKIRGRIKRVESVLAHPTLKCTEFINRCSNDRTIACDGDKPETWATACGSATAGCLNSSSSEPFHYVSTTACAADADCTSKGAGYLCDTVKAKCAKDTCTYDACFGGGELEAATRYRGSHFALTDNCFRRAIGKIYASGGTVEIIQDTLFWHNIYSASRLLCNELNPGDTANRFTVKVENWNGKDHEKNFCIEKGSTDTVCHLGSANVSTNSEKNNTEGSLLFYNNATYAAAFTKHMEKMMYGKKEDGTGEYAYPRLKNIVECSTTSADTSMALDTTQ